ncbi:MAG: hypothetical protein ACRCTP_04135 [Aeromonas popoffii]|uniref:hypothetical protein n=1 Tax=Aeromonas popoffii TaxID=70856 RepID=UPI003F2E3E79
MEPANKINVWEWLEGAATVCEGMGCPPIINRTEFEASYAEGEEIPFQVGESAIITFVPSDGAVYLSVNDGAPSSHTVAVLVSAFERAGPTPGYHTKKLGLPFAVVDGAVHFISN